MQKDSRFRYRESIAHPVDSNRIPSIVVAIDITRTTSEDGNDLGLALRFFHLPAFAEFSIN